MFEVSGTPKDLSFLFRFLVRRVSSLCDSISTLDSKCWTESVAISCPSSSLILLMEEVSGSSRYWYRESSKVIISSDAFCIIPFARFKKREEGNPGAMIFALRVKPFGITLWYKHLLRNSQWCKYRTFFRVFEVKGRSNFRDTMLCMS